MSEQTDDGRNQLSLLEDKSFKAAVIFIDGSCRPKVPGYIGWGAHGYIYDDYVEKPVMAHKSRLTDVGYKEESITLDETVKFVKPLFYLDFFGPSRRIETNNVAELRAFIATVTALSKTKFEKIQFYTDSEYLRKGMQIWSKGWIRNNWQKPDGREVPNKDLWIQVLELNKEAAARGCTISVDWVRSHCGIYGNIHADMLAGIGMNHSRESVFLDSYRVTKALGYWKHDPDKHPYLNYRRVYFNTTEQYNLPGMYHMAETKSQDFILGKQAPDCAYAVVKLNEPDPILELVKKKHYEVANGMNMTSMIRTDVVFGKEVYPWLHNYGPFPIVPSREGSGLELIDKTRVSTVVNPTGLSYRAVDAMMLLEDMLTSFFKAKELGTEMYTAGSKVTTKDITDIFFTKTPNKKGVLVTTLRKEIVNDATPIEMYTEEEIDGKTIKIKIPYSLGLDCIPRNALRRIEGEDPQLWLITWKESSEVIRYATIIQSKAGCGIWSNYYADRIYLRALT